MELQAYWRGNHKIQSRIQVLRVIAIRMHLNTDAVSKKRTSTLFLRVPLDLLLHFGQMGRLHGILYN